MSQVDRPSTWCPDYCQHVIHQDFICRKFKECHHLKDRKVAPEVVEITIGGQSKRVTIVGENDVFKPIYYLENGSLLPKNYKIFNELPTPRKEKTQKEKYDEMKAREKLKR